MCERPLAHDRASPIEQAGLVLRRAPVDAGEPAYCLLSHCLVSHGPVLSCPTSHHDACRNLYLLALEGATSYWASVVASLPGHRSTFGARGTSARMVAPDR